MRKLNKAISAIISVCFIVNSAITDIAIGQDLFRHDDSATLAASSRCDDINGPELAEITKVKCALMAQLLTMAGEGKSIDSLDFSELVRKASAYNNSVFSLSDVQTFIHESDAASNGLPAGYRCVMCRVKDPLAGFANKPLMIYYAVFALERDSLGGFPIYVYKENEYARFLKAGTLASLPRREASVENAISRNIAHQVSARSGEKAVDEFISERIKAGDFTEFEGRANELLWNYRGTFPDRKKSGNYRFLPSVRFQAVWGRLHPFLAHLDIGFQEALNSRNIVFIRVPEGVKYPVIHERDPASGKDMPVSVRSHTSENCVYIFLDDETFSAMVNGDNVSDSELLGLIVHEIGVIYGLPLSVVNSHGGASIVNDLDLAYAAYTSTMHANLDDEAALLAIDAVMKDSPALKNIRYAPEKARI